MKTIPCSCLHFRMTDHASLYKSLGSGVVIKLLSKVDAPVNDQCPTVNTRSTFAELAVELGLREVES